MTLEVLAKAFEDYKAQVQQANDEMVKVVMSLNDRITALEDAVNVGNPTKGVALEVRLDKLQKTYAQLKK